MFISRNLPIVYATTYVLYLRIDHSSAYFHVYIVSISLYGSSLHAACCSRQYYSRNKESELYTYSQNYTAITAWWCRVVSPPKSALKDGIYTTRVYLICVQ